MKNQKTLLTLVSLILFTKISFAQCTTFPLVVTGTVNASLLPTTILTGGNDINNKSFNLNGTLTVNIPILTITSSTIEMGANAKIIVNANCSLVIRNNSWLRACSVGTGEMWEGIEMQGTISSTASTIVITGNSKIDDAKAAIYSFINGGFPAGYQKVNVNIDGATFNRNYRAIHLADLSFTNSSMVVKSFSLKNANFYCRDNSGIPANALHIPYAGQRTFAAIDLGYAWNAGLTTSNLIIGTNVIIENAKYGVKSYGNGLELNNVNISRTEWGIHNQYDGRFKMYNSNISSATVAAMEVFNYLIELTVFNNTISQCGRGIHVYTQVRNIKIYNNTITNCANWAIYGSMCFYPSGGINTIDIYSNTISANTLTADGIYWNEVQLAAGVSSTFKIRDHINISGIRKGIELLNVPKPEITDNPIININANAGFGIKITNSSNALIKSNIVSGVVASACTSNTSGIINENSLGAQVKCNLAQNVTKGFVFKGVTTASSFLQNTMGKAQNQFYLENNAGGLGNVGGASSPSLNVWQAGACDGFRSTNGIGSNITTSCPACTTKFFYYNAGNGHNPTFNFMSPPGAPCTKQGTSFLPQNGYCTTGGGGTTAALLEPIVDGSTTWAIEDKASELMAKEYVYEEIKADPTLLQSTILADAVNEIENSTLGELLAVNDSISSDSIAVDSLQLVNSTITTNYLAEENFKIINELLLVAEDATFVGYDTAQLQTIADIANQCPLEGGNAVYTARAILANITGEVADYENDCVNYSGGNNRLTHNTTENNLPEKEKIVTHINYYDLQGRLILTQKISADEKIEIKNGIYIAKSFSNDELVSIEKVISIK